MLVFSVVVVVEICRVWHYRPPDSCRWQKADGRNIVGCLFIVLDAKTSKIGARTTPLITIAHGCFNHAAATLAPDPAKVLQNSNFRSWEIVFGSGVELGLGLRLSGTL